MQSTLYFDWSDLNSLTPWKDRRQACKDAFENCNFSTPTLLVRANRYRGFALYVIDDAGLVPVRRNGSFAWFSSIDACAEALLDLDADLDFENILLDLGVWDCRSVPPRVEERRPAKTQDRCLAAKQRQLLRPLGAF